MYLTYITGLQLLCRKWQKRSRRVQAAYYETTCLVWVGIGRGQKNKQMWLPKIIYSSIYLLMQKASHLFWMATQYKQRKKTAQRDAIMTKGSGTGWVRWAFSCSFNSGNFLLWSMGNTKTVTKFKEPCLFNNTTTYYLRFFWCTKKQD